MAIAQLVRWVLGGNAVMDFEAAGCRQTHVERNLFRFSQSHETISNGMNSVLRTARCD